MLAHFKSRIRAEFADTKLPSEPHKQPSTSNAISGSANVELSDARAVRTSESAEAVFFAECDESWMICCGQVATLPRHTSHYNLNVVSQIDTRQGQLPKLIKSPRESVPQKAHIDSRHEFEYYPHSETALENCPLLEDCCTMLLLPYKVRYIARSLYYQVIVQLNYVIQLLTELLIQAVLRCGQYLRSNQLAGASIYAACKVCGYDQSPLHEICEQCHVTPRDVTHCYEVLLAKLPATRRSPQHFIPCETITVD